MSSDTNRDVTITGNTFVKYVDIRTWTTAIVNNNTFYSSDVVLNTQSPTAGFGWSGNAHYRDSSISAWSANGSAYTFAGWRSASGLGSSDRVPGKRPSGGTDQLRTNRY